MLTPTSMRLTCLIFKQTRKGVLLYDRANFALIQFELATFDDGFMTRFTDRNVENKKAE